MLMLRTPVSLTPDFHVFDGCVDKSLLLVRLDWSVGLHLWSVCSNNEAHTPQGGCENRIRFPTMSCVYRKEGAKAVTRTQPLFAFGIAMETETLYIESLGCSHSPAAYHSVRMFEANGAQFRSCNLFQRRARTVLCVARRAEQGTNPSRVVSTNLHRVKNVSVKSAAFHRSPGLPSQFSSFRFLGSWPGA